MCFDERVDRFGRIRPSLLFYSILAAHIGLYRRSITPERVEVSPIMYISRSTYRVQELLCGKRISSGKSPRYYCVHNHAIILSSLLDEIFTSC